jgi:glyoxylase-like metal-dependent hydrolase (beta-lactamase superfamily II)
MRRVFVLGALVSAGTIPIGAAGWQAHASHARAEANAIRMEKLKDNLYVAKGGGGNVTVFITDLGVVIVDTKLAGWSQPLLDQIKTVTGKKITTLINTHAHPDHVGGNDAFGTAVEIVAHENTRANMEKSDAFTEARVNFLPKLMFKEKMSLGAGKDKIELYYFGSGHTNGDAWVVFPAARVMHAGDMFESKQLPLVDRNSGGSGIAFPDTLAKAAAAAPNVDAVVSGHDGIMTIADLEEYSRFTREFRDLVVDGFHHGLSVNDVIRKWKVPARYKGYVTGSPERLRDDVEQIFGELAK